MAQDSASDLDNHSGSAEQELLISTGWLGTGVAKPFLAGLITSSAIVLSSHWWYDAHLGFTTLFAVVEPDPTPREAFLADQAGRILMALSGVVSVRVAGFRWLPSIFISIAIHIAAIIPLLLLVVLLGPAGMLLFLLVWPVSLVGISKWRAARRFRSSSSLKFHDNRGRNIQEIVAWCSVFPILAAVFVRAATLSDH